MDLSIAPTNLDYLTAVLETAHQERPTVTLLGGFRLSHGGAEVHLPRPAQRLVAHLVLKGQTDRQVLSGRLWAELPEQAARAALRNALWQTARRQPGLVNRGRFLSLSEDSIVDVHTMRTCAWAAIEGDPQEMTEAATMAALTACKDSELLPGWYDDWLDDVREELRQLRMHALESLSRSLLAQRRFALALHCALEVTHMEPLRETAAASVINVHLAEHNLVEAVRFYDDVARRLADELGVQPSVQLRNLISSPRATQPIGVP